MTAAVNEGPFHPPLRLWPGVVAAVILLVARFGVPLVSPEAGGAAILGGMAGSLLVIVWWLFLSRAAWRERLGAIALMAAAPRGDVARRPSVDCQRHDGLHVVHVRPSRCCAWRWSPPPFLPAGRRARPRRVSIDGRHPARMRLVHAPAY